MTLHLYQTQVELKPGTKGFLEFLKLGADPDGNCYEQCKGAGSCRSGRAADPGVFFLLYAPDVK